MLWTVGRNKAGDGDDRGGEGGGGGGGGKEGVGGRGGRGQVRILSWILRGIFPEWPEARPANPAAVPGL
eukprot:224512-Pyramimonas_sp.AAC.1